MAKKADFTIAQELRPCTIRGVRALFHRWVEEREIVGGNVSATVFGIVEYSTGLVVQVPPSDVFFLDSRRKFDQYDWRECDDR